MPKNKRKFISKENSVTFHLVHRSQQDPLVTDENAPQRVLVAQSEGKKKSKNSQEEHKYGIFFDDDYDYLQHLRGAEEMEVHWEQTDPKSNVRVKSEKPKKVQLPSSVFASQFEEPIGLLNKAAPQSGLRLELDPDIVAAMDDDFNFEDPDNELEDDFIKLANAEGGSEEEEEDDESLDSGNSAVDSDMEEDDLASLPGGFGEVETKSRFTDYSLSSSVIRRNNQLTLLDDRFEKIFESYDEGEIGALDMDEIEGAISTGDERLLALTEESEEPSAVLREPFNLKDRILSLASNEEEDLENFVTKIQKEKWDCESIISTYSNIYNHPVKIEEPKKPRKIKIDRTGMPVNELEGRKEPLLTAHNLAALEGNHRSDGPRSTVSRISELSYRPKNESPEERRVRKQNIREYRGERRKERKANTAAFTEEKKRQEKVLLNLRNNLQGIKIL